MDHVAIDFSDFPITETVEHRVPVGLISGIWVGDDGFNGDTNFWHERSGGIESVDLVKNGSDFLGGIGESLGELGIVANSHFDPSVRASNSLFYGSRELRGDSVILKMHRDLVFLPGSAMSLGIFHMFRSVEDGSLLDRLEMVGSSLASNVSDEIIIASAKRNLRIRLSNDLP